MVINILNISRLRTYSDGDGISTLVGCMGCPLRCAYCLNPYSWDGSIIGEKLTVDELYDKVKIDNLYFLSTGGGIVFGEANHCFNPNSSRILLKNTMILDGNLALKHHYLQKKKIWKN